MHLRRCEAFFLHETRLRALLPGSFNTEPANDNHFAETGDDVLVQISGLGPTGTTYVDSADNPKY